MYGLPDSGDGERRIRRRSQVNRNSNCVSILDSTRVRVVVWRQPRLRRIHLPGSWFQHHIVNEVRVVALPGLFSVVLSVLSRSVFGSIVITVHSQIRKQRERERGETLTFKAHGEIEVRRAIKSLGR